MSSWYCGRKKFSLLIAALLLFQVFTQFRVAQNRAAEKKQRKGRGRKEAPTLFFLLVFLWVVPTIWTFLALADLAVAVSKNDTKTINISKFDQAVFFFFGKQGKFSLTGLLLHHVHFHLVETVGLQTTRLLTT